MFSGISVRRNSPSGNRKSLHWEKKESDKMDKLFLEVINLAVSATWAMLAVMVLRLALKKAPRFLVCALWLLPAVRLIWPFPFLSLFSLVPSAQTVSPYIAEEGKPAIDSGIRSVDHSVNQVLAEHFTASPGTSMNPLQLVVPLLAAVWLLGVLALLTYGAVSFLRLKRRVKGGRWDLPYSESASPFAPCYFCKTIDTPFILGVFRPAIYLPQGMSEEEARWVLAHEKAHLKRKDHWWKPLGFLLLAVYWFHPLCWVCYWLFCKDLETACDEKAVKDMSLEARKDYSRTLLAHSAPRGLFPASPLAFGEVAVKKRVKSVLRYKKPALWAVLLTLSLTCIAWVCFGSNPTYSVPDDYFERLNAIKAEDIEQVSCLIREKDGELSCRSLSEAEIDKLAGLLGQVKGKYMGSRELEGDRAVALLVETTESAGRWRFDLVTDGGTLWVDDQPVDPGWWWMPKGLREIWNDPGLKLMEQLAGFGGGQAGAPPDYLFADRQLPMVLVDNKSMVKTQERACVFSDGNYVDQWQVVGWSGMTSRKEYRLPDGTVLFENRGAGLPGEMENASISGVSDLSETAREKVIAYYQRQNADYDISGDLESAYEAYLQCQQDGSEYSPGVSSREVITFAANDKVLWLCAMTTKNQQYWETGAAFDRKTGDYIPAWELFTVPKEEVVRRVVSAAQATAPTQEQKKQIESVPPENVVFQQDTLEIWLSDGCYAVDIEDVKDILKPWAVPDRAEG